MELSEHIESVKRHHIQIREAVSEIVKMAVMYGYNTDAIAISRTMEEVKKSMAVLEKDLWEFQDMRSHDNKSKDSE